MKIVETNNLSASFERGARADVAVAIFYTSVPNTKNEVGYELPQFKYLSDFVRRNGLSCLAVCQIYGKKWSIDEVSATIEIAKNTMKGNGLSRIVIIGVGDAASAALTAASEISANKCVLISPDFTEKESSIESYFDLISSEYVDYVKNYVHLICDRRELYNIGSISAAQSSLFTSIYDVPYSGGRTAELLHDCNLIDDVLLSIIDREEFPKSEFRDFIRRRRGNSPKNYSFANLWFRARGKFEIADRCVDLSVAKTLEKILAQNDVRKINREELRLKARLASATGSFAEAIDTLKILLDANMEDRSSLNLLVDTLAASGDGGNISKGYREFFDSFQHYEGPTMRMAGVLHKFGLYEDLVHLCRLGLEHFPQRKEKFISMMAHIESETTFEREMNAMRRPRVTFALASYGEKYLPFVYASVASIKKHMPDAPITLFWSDTPAHEISIISAMYKDLHLRSMDGISPIIEDASDDQMVSQKMRYWLPAIKEAPGEYVVVMDTDTLLCRDISEFLEEDFDLILTYRERGLALNSGVTIIRRSEAMINFVADWMLETTAILSDAQRALDAAKAHGGADQQALVNVAGYKNQRVRYEQRGLTIWPVSCNVLNEIRCTPQTDQTHIFHLKGGWHGIILEAKAFSEGRPCKACFHILSQWIDSYRRGSAIAFKNFINSLELDAAHRLSSVGKIATALNSDRIVIFTNDEVNPDFVSQFQTTLPVVKLSAEASDKRVTANLAEGAPTVVIWGLPFENASRIRGAIPASTRVRAVFSPFKKSLHDQLAKFPFYRSIELEPGVGEGQMLRSVSAPTYLDHAHRRRNPDWAGQLLAGGEPAEEGEAR